MSGVTPIDQIAGGLQQAFKVFVENYKAPEATRTWGDYLFQPAALVSDLTALVTGVRSQEHDLQKKFFEELKQTLDQSFGEKQTSFQVIFFNYLVAFKLIERLNRSVLEYLGGTGPDGKSVPQKTVAGINFVRFYDEYSKSVSEITKGYSLRVADLLKVIDQHISPEDFEKILKAPSEKAGEKTGGAFFEVLLARLEEALWTPEQQRAFGIEFSELAGAAGAPPGLEVGIGVAGGATAGAAEASSDFVDAPTDEGFSDLPSGASAPAGPAAPAAPERRASLGAVGGAATAVFNLLVETSGVTVVAGAASAAGVVGRVPMAAPGAS